MIEKNKFEGTRLYRFTIVFAQVDMQVSNVQVSHLLLSCAKKKKKEKKKKSNANTMVKPNAPNWSRIDIFILSAFNGKNVSKKKIKLTL